MRGHSFVAVLIFTSVSVAAVPEQMENYGQLMETIRQKNLKFSDLKTSIASLDKLCTRSVDFKNQASNDIKAILKAIGDPAKKANLLSALLDAKNLCRDQRQLRQWIDELNEILEEEDLPSECRNQCLLAIGGEELLMGNFMEAEKIYSQLEEVYEGQGNDEQHVKILDALESAYLYKGDREMFDHIFKKKALKLTRLSSRSKILAEVSSSTAMKCALLREWALFDEMCEKSAAADDGKKLCSVLTSLLFGNMNAIVGKAIADQVAIQDLQYLY